MISASIQGSHPRLPCTCVSRIYILAIFLEGMAYLMGLQARQSGLDGNVEAVMRRKLRSSECATRLRNSSNVPH